MTKLEVPTQAEKIVAGKKSFTTEFTSGMAKYRVASTWETKNKHTHRIIDRN